MYTHHTILYEALLIFLVQIDVIWQVISFTTKALSSVIVLNYLTFFFFFFKRLCESQCLRFCFLLLSVKKTPDLASLKIKCCADVLPMLLPFIETGRHA